MDNELFELCKEVYEKTGWREPSFGGLIPTYTSDYLLEKLQGVYGWSDFSLTSDPAESGVVWQSLYYTYDGMDYKYKSDTPLKALLKLVIALNDAGVNL